MPRKQVIRCMKSEVRYKMVDRIIIYVVALISGLALFSSCSNDDDVDASRFMDYDKGLCYFRALIKQAKGEFITFGN